MVMQIAGPLVIQPKKSEYYIRPNDSFQEALKQNHLKIGLDYCPQTLGVVELGFVSAKRDGSPVRAGVTGGNANIRGTQAGALSAATQRVIPCKMEDGSQ